MKKILAIMAFAVCCGSAAAQQAYTLEQLKKLAVDNNYSLRSARNSIEQSKQQRREALTKFFPTISAMGAGMAANKNMVEIGMPDELVGMAKEVAGITLPNSIGAVKDGVYASVTAIQPVFMGGQVINGNKLAKVGVEASEIQLEQSADQVELTTEQYYWQIVSLKEKLKTLGSLHKMLAEVEKDAASMVKSGVVNRNDLLQVQLRRAQVETSIVETENALSTISQLLAQHVGKTGEKIDIVWNQDAAKTVPDMPLTLRRDHQAALGATPAYRLMEKNVEMNRLQHKMKVGENLPQVAVGADYSYSNIMESSSTGMVFATVRVPISGWWGGSHAIKKQKLALDDAREQLQDNSQKLIINMNNAWSAVETSHRKLQIAADAIAQAEENLRLNRDYYRVGATKMSDLLEAQEQYQQACDRYTDAFAEFQMKQLEYRQATGQE